METTFYDDNNLSVKKMKTSMTLDLSHATTNKKFVDFPTTPDLGLFMISTPEMERLMSHQHGNMILTTPTPTSQILFPKTVTEEQEAYARGFIDALGELQKNDSHVTSSVTVGNNGSSQRDPVPVSRNLNFNHQTTKFDVPQSTSIKTLNTAALNNMLYYNSNSNAAYSSQVNIKTSKHSGDVDVGHQNAFSQLPVHLPQKLAKVESFQTVPRSPPSDSYSPPRSSHSGVSQGQMTPINMDDQEMVKLERKRARNRIAATKCRNRKLERISRLEDRVKELKDQNLNLAQTAGLLREQVFKLKQTIVDHTQQGCQVMLSSKFLDSATIFG